MSSHPGVGARCAGPLVIVPTYNERDNLPLIVRALLDTRDLHVLVVDDGSPDGTGQRADELRAADRDRMSVIHRTGPRGLGLSYIEGMRMALDLEAPFICQMDADLSHDPADVPRLVAAARTGDLAIGSGRHLDLGPCPRKLAPTHLRPRFRSNPRLDAGRHTGGCRRTELFVSARCARKCTQRLSVVSYSAPNAIQGTRRTL